MPSFDVSDIASTRPYYEFGFITGTTHHADLRHDSLLYTPRHRVGRPYANCPGPADRRSGAARPCTRRTLLRHRIRLVPLNGRTGPSPGSPGPCYGSSTSSLPRRGELPGGDRRTSLGHRRRI